MLEKTFQPAELEERHYQEWEESGHFKCDPSSKTDPFTVMMPPPNVTGSLHMGHALNCTLHDILVRWNRMKGKDTLWQPGLDHAGIATQMVVERNLAEDNIDRRDLGREEFIKKVWEWKEQSGGTIVGQQKRLGTTPDWERERFTMDEGLSKAVIKVFVQLYNEGLIYRDKRLVNWDPKFQTSISDLEVEHKDINGSMYHVQYPLEEGGGFINIATTRPETILADGAIAVNPDDERYKDLVGKFAVVPVCDRIIPIIADEYVDAEFGSGAVKITAAHDYNDFEVAKRHPDKNIALINLLTPDGKMNENCPEAYVGLDRFEARKKIVKDLDELEYLIKVEKHKHQVPYGDRSGVVVEPYLTDQWYVDAEKMAIPAIEAVETGKTEFIPKNWENTYFSWMKNIQPWCISRQLWWGHQIPAWYDEEGKVYVAASEEEAQEQAGADKKLTRDPDVLDTWFSSALWPFSTLGWPDKTPELDKYYPGDTLITGFDIIFFWVARMMMMGIHFMDDVPFKKVYIHALVRDGKGQKMSKSKGNVIDPLDLIEKYGADSLRFTLAAMAAQGRDVRLSEDRVAGYRNFTTKLWNAARYCEMNEALPQADFDPTSVQHTLNHWIIGEVIDCQAAINKALESYRFNDAANAAYQFVWGTFCDWYLEFTKPLISGEDEVAKAEVRATTGWVLEQILRLLHPMMPYITEELYASIAKREEGDLLIGSKWPDYSAIERDECAAKKIGWVMSIISEIRSVRADMNVPAKAQVALLVKDACDMTKQGFEAFGEVMQKMARLESIDYADEAPKGSIQTVVDNTTLILPIADLIDLDQERERLQKEIDKLDDNIKKISGQLDNQNFVANAPKEVIDEKKEIVANDEKKKTKLRTALEQLNAA
ncbi:MAG: valine--tRNA ligase [Micavibrio sp.]|nr:valine--tRNA ligase [Micavibrio sp.]